MGLVNIAPGATFVPRIVMTAWKVVHAVSPRVVGGCRPISLRTALPGNAWTMVVERAVLSWALTSEVVLARRVPA